MVFPEALIVVDLIAVVLMPRLTWTVPGIETTMQGLGKAVGQ